MAKSNTEPILYELNLSQNRCTHDGDARRI